MQTPYETLGVSKSASQDEIKNAYRKLAKKFHPDLNPGNKDAEKKFKMLNEANEQIGTPEARAKYDRGESEAHAGGAGATAGGPNPFGGGQYYQYTRAGPGRDRYTSGFQGVDDDLFESIFGGRGGARAAGAHGGFQQAPTDENYQMEIDFRDSILGGEREITLPGGKRLRVKIPPGIESGKKLRFAGQAAGGGDVYVAIEVQPSHDFRRLGQHLETEVAITIADAILGGEVAVPTLEGTILLNVPPGVSTGQKLRAAGKGVPAHGPLAAGDLRVTLKIVAPREVDAEFKAAVQAWRARGGDRA